MRILILSLFLAVLLSSCHNRWLVRNQDEICSNICPEQVIFKTDTVRETITEIEKLPPVIDTLYINVPYNLYDTIIIEDKTWRAKFFLTESKLSADIQHLSDSINMIKTTKSEVIHTESERIIFQKVKNPVNKWLIYICLLLVVGVVWAYRKVLLITLRRILLKV